MVLYPPMSRELNILASRASFKKRQILTCDMSMERIQFLKHNPVIRLKILLIVFLVERFKNFDPIRLPVRFYSKLVYGWTDMSLNRNLAEETHVRIDTNGALSRLKGLLKPQRNTIPHRNICKKPVKESLKPPPLLGFTDQLRVCGGGMYFT